MGWLRGQDTSDQYGGLEKRNNVSLSRTDSEDALQLQRHDTQETLVEGTSQLYQNGIRQFVPMPSADPKDPLNLPNWRKGLIISIVCFFGAMVTAAEVILAALLPVFEFQYGGFDPHILDHLHGLAQAPGGGPDLELTSKITSKHGPPTWKVTLISTLPFLVIGVSNYFLVPLSIALGRRPVIIVCGLLGWCGALWAAASGSLESHLGARAVQALGAGTVETIMPLVVQDLVFIHWRNRAFSAIWAAQGIIIVTLGICSPLIIIKTSWRWLYNITAIFAAFAWLLIIIFMPETRYIRSNAELRGEPVKRLPPGELRPAIDTARYTPRTWSTEVGIFHFGIHWRRAGEAFLASLKSFFFPNILWLICLNGTFTAVSLAAGQVGSSVLMTVPNSWPFRLIGLAVLPIVIASVFVALYAYGAEKSANYITRTWYQGRREPEIHLLNMVIPLLFAISGCLMFGAGGAFLGHISWGVFVVGIGFIAFGFLTVNVICSVYVVEAYPDWAGPVLVNSGSFRNIIGFALSFRVVAWIEQLGFWRMFGIYAGIIALISLIGIAIFIYGKAIRKYCGQFVIPPHDIHPSEQAEINEREIEKKEKRPAVFGRARDTKRGLVVGSVSSSSSSSSHKSSPNSRAHATSSSSRQQPLAAGKDETEKGKEVKEESLQIRTYRSRPVGEPFQPPGRSQSQLQSKKSKRDSKSGSGGGGGDDGGSGGGGGGGGIDWEHVKECLNMRSKWGDPAMH